MRSKPKPDAYIIYRAMGDIEVSLTRPVKNECLGYTPLYARHPSVVTCSDCGLDYIDDGLNPLYCPYCMIGQLEERGNGA